MYFNIFHTNISQEEECPDTFADQQNRPELPTAWMRSVSDVEDLDLPNVVERPIDVSFFSFHELKNQKY